MKYKIYKNNTCINIIDADEVFINNYCINNNYTYELLQDILEPNINTIDTQQLFLHERLKELEIYLTEVDEIAIQLYEANLKQEAINAEQDEAIIEIYEAMGVVNNG